MKDLQDLKDLHHELYTQVDSPDVEGRYAYMARRQRGRGAESGEFFNFTDLGVNFVSSRCFPG